MDASHQGGRDGGPGPRDGGDAPIVMDGAVGTDASSVDGSSMDGAAGSDGSRPMTGGSGGSGADGSALRDAASDAAALCTGTEPANSLLILFDQSASINEAWGSTTKLAVALEGVRAGVAALPSSTDVAAMFFPTTACIPFLEPPAGGSVTTIDMAPQIAFRSPSAFLEAWDAKWGATPTADGIGSPLQEAFDRADQALSELAPSSGPIHVVLVTDGAAPNCFPDGDGDGGSVAMWPTQRMEDRVDSWQVAGIVFDVIALPTADSSAADALAAVTGRPAIVPDDAASVAMSLRALTCTD